MRILIATVTAGAGHLQAAAALKEAWPLVSPKDEVIQVDVLDHVPKLHRKVYVDGYVKLIEKARTQAQNLFEQDSDLSKPENALLAEAFGRFWGEGKGDVS